MTAPLATVVITVAGVKKRVAVRCDLLGDDQVTGGAGGWEEVEGGKKKSRRKGLAFKGTPGYTLTLPLGFNGLEAGTVGRAVSIEAQCRRLVEFGQAAKKGTRPPRLHVAGLVRVPTTVEWVIDSITWGAQIRNAEGARVQQRFDLALIQYRPPGSRKSPAKDSK